MTIGVIFYSKWREKIGRLFALGVHTFNFFEKMAPFTVLSGRRNLSLVLLPQTLVRNLPANDETHSVVA